MFLLLTFLFTNVLAAVDHGAHGPFERPLSTLEDPHEISVSWFLSPVFDIVYITVDAETKRLGLDPVAWVDIGISYDESLDGEAAWASAEVMRVDLENQLTTFRGFSAEDQLRDFSREKDSFQFSFSLPWTQGHSGEDSGEKEWLLFAMGSGDDVAERKAFLLNLHDPEEGPLESMVAAPYETDKKPNWKGIVMVSGLVVLLLGAVVVCRVELKKVDEDIAEEQRKLTLGVPERPFSPFVGGMGSQKIQLGGADSESFNMDGQECTSTGIVPGLAASLQARGTGTTPNSAGGSRPLKLNQWQNSSRGSVPMPSPTILNVKSTVLSPSGAWTGNLTVPKKEPGLKSTLLDKRKRQDWGQVDLTSPKIAMI